ncbi:hypothetical protein ACHAWT_006181 [Skeletonema menzelii]|mmetsp:Transcript_3209/g.5387  ORF Transcript_3209/g.5387 Transcript_3209/m.5387 type:complete len:195 (-) Transcript_3209:15-599(-)
MPPKVRVKIPVHVLVYSLGFFPAAAYAYHWYKNAPTDEEFEQQLSKNYAQNIQSSREKHVQMTQFLQNMNDPNNSEQQKRMQEVLLGGRGQKKRLYAVDEDIYGTEEGAKLQKEAVDNSRGSGKIIKNKKNKKKNKRKDETDGERATLANDDNSTTTTTGTESSVRLKQSVAGVVVAGTLAAGISMLLGGGKRS